MGATSGSTCQSCVAGTYTSFDGASVCMLCLYGSFALTGSTSCSRCGPGSYSAKNGSESCIDCSTGHYASYMGATICSPCALNVDSNLNSTNITCVSINNNSLCTMNNKCLDPQCRQGILGRYTPGEVYNDNELMTITIVSPPLTVISLIFTLFMTEPDYDGVQVFTCTDATCRNSTLLGFFSEKEIPPPQYSYTGVMQIVWSSDVCCPKPSSACPCDDPINANLLSGWLANFFVSGPTECSKCAGSTENCESAYLDNRRHPNDHDLNIGVLSSKNFLLRDLAFMNDQKAAKSMFLTKQAANNLFSRNAASQTSVGLQSAVNQQIGSVHDKKIMCGIARELKSGAISSEREDGCVSEHFFPVSYLARTGFTPARRAWKIVPNVKVLTRSPANFQAELRKTVIRTAIQHQNQSFLIQICDLTNDAAYGPCIASTYSTLQIFDLPTSERPSFPGLEFQMIVTKEDSYGQTIITDSTSLLQVFAVREQANQSLSVLGTTVVQMQEGRAVFSISIQPNFMDVSFTHGFTQLQSKPFVYFSGIDSEAILNLIMRSANVRINIANGSTVCPTGYILNLEDANRVGARRGSCSLCKPGTYSVSPLKGVTSDQDPSCLNCPLGGDCSVGGDNVTFAIGEWIVSKGIYKLVQCPAGYGLQNSITGHIFSQDSQACLKCISDEYIVNSSNPNYKCMICPVGAICDGNSLRGRVPGSVWKPDLSDGIFILQYCPAVSIILQGKNLSGV